MTVSTAAPTAGPITGEDLKAWGHRPGPQFPALLAFKEAPLGNLARRPGSAFLDLTGEEQPKPVDPFPHALMANVDAAFVQQVLGISERQRKADIHHDLQADDFRRRFEVAEGRFAHPKTMA